MIPSLTTKNFACCEILVVSDPHFVGVARHTCNHPERQTRLGQILLRKALGRLQHLGVTPDAIVLLGDMVDDGTKPGAEEDWQTLADEVHKTGIPVLAVPGNHDTDAKRFAQVFGCAPGMHVVGDYVFLVFHDERQNGELFRRPADQLDLPARAAAAYPGKPIITLQHHPHDPVIREGYPYHLTNRAEVMAGYRDAGVCLSLSGHYHAGQAAHEVAGVTYATAPALCEAPFRFLLIRMEGRHAQVQEHALRLDAPGAAPADIPRLLLRPGSAGVPPAKRKEPREWHSRGYLPHFDHPGLVQSITFRVADSLPMEVVLRLSQRKTVATDADAVELRKTVETALDRGVGACHLKNLQVAQIVQDALLHFDGERYRLLAWVVMPNHVHVMIETLPGFRLDEVVHSWKSYTAKKCNRLLGQTGAFWEAEYFDRFIRNAEHFRKAREYIEENPVKAHLAAKAGDWVYSSARSTGSAGGTDFTTCG